MGGLVRDDDSVYSKTAKPYFSMPAAFAACLGLGALLVGEVQLYLFFPLWYWLLNTAATIFAFLFISIMEYKRNMKDIEQLVQLVPRTWIIKLETGAYVFVFSYVVFILVYVQLTKDPTWSGDQVMGLGIIASILIVDVLRDKKRK